MKLDFDGFEVLTFDCYGTLIDWENGILDAIRPVLDRYKIQADDGRLLELYASIEAKQESFEHVRYEVLLRLLMTEMSFHLGFDATLMELDCVARSIKDWKPFPDTVAALQRLKSCRKLAVISNIDDRLFSGTARRLGVPFDWVITAEQAGAYKPAHAVFEFAFEKIGVDPDRILHVAQSLYHDIRPAKALGLATVWVNRRVGREGFGATPAAVAEPDFEVPDLKTLVDAMGL